MAKEEANYNVEVLGRHVMVTDAMKQYVMDKVHKIDHFTNRVIDVVVTMDIQKLDHMVDILMKVGPTMIKVQAIDADMYAAVDRASDKLIEKLRRWKGKLNNHHNKPLSMVDMKVNVFKPTDPTTEVNDQIEDENQSRAEQALQPHHIVKTETMPLKLLSVAEAEMKMELSEDHFMVYRCEEDNKLKVIYRREDGNFGVIEPE